MSDEFGLKTGHIHLLDKRGNWELIPRIEKEAEHLLQEFRSTHPLFLKFSPWYSLISFFAEGTLDQPLVVVKYSGKKVFHDLFSHLLFLTLQTNRRKDEVTKSFVDGLIHHSADTPEEDEGDYEIVQTRKGTCLFLELFNFYY